MNFWFTFVMILLPHIIILLSYSNTIYYLILSYMIHYIISSVQSLSCAWLFATPWTAARQASLSITNSRHLPNPMSTESVMPSNHLILCYPFSSCPQRKLCPNNNNPRSQGRQRAASLQVDVALMASRRWHHHSHSMPPEICSQGQHFSFVLLLLHWSFPVNPLSVLAKLLQ